MTATLCPRCREELQPHQVCDTDGHRHHGWCCPTPAAAGDTSRGRWQFAGMPAPAAAGCGCEVVEGQIRHRQATCTDPVVSSLGWYADGSDPRVTSAPARPHRGGGSLAQAAAVMASINEAAAKVEAASPGDMAQLIIRVHPGLLVSLTTSGAHASDSINKRFYSVGDPPPDGITPEIFWAVLLDMVARFLATS